MLQTFNISNRRYLGNKYKLLSWIKGIIEENCTNVESFFDVFSGTGSVASAFTDKRLVVCDMMKSNYYAALCWFSPQEIDREKLTRILEAYNSYDASNEDNYMSQNFSDTYFNRETCQKIGFIRDDVENKLHNGEINEREHACVITSLFYAMDRISHTCGHYGSFIRDGKYEGVLELRMPENGYHINEGNHIYCADSNTIADLDEVDIAYLDPPYNSRQYCSMYHVLENLAKWDKPPLYRDTAKPLHLDNKSDFCKKKAIKAFTDLVTHVDARYIAVSYSNTYDAKSKTSNNKMTLEEIRQILELRGTTKMFCMDYKPFNTGKTELVNHQEILFLTKVIV